MLTDEHVQFLSKTKGDIYNQKQELRNLGSIIALLFASGKLEMSVVYPILTCINEVVNQLELLY